MADQRISVLQAIGNVSKNAVSGANTLQNLSTNVSENFLTLLQAEGMLKYHIFTTVKTVDSLIFSQYFPMDFIG